MRSKVEKKIKNEDHFYEIDNDILALINYGEYDLLKQVIRESFVVDNLTMMGMPLVFYAVKKGRKKFLKALLDVGSDINLYNTSFRATPIFVAVKNNDVEMIKYLIDHGAQYNITNGDGYSLPGYAITTRSIDAFEYLLQIGAMLNETSDILYSLKNNVKYVKLFHKYEIISKNWYSNEEKHILEVAEELENKMVIKYIRRICNE